MFPTLIKQLIHITERQNRLLLALLCPLFLSAMTTEEGKKKTTQTYTRKCAKELEAPAQMARMSGISSTTVCDCIY